MLLLTKLDSGQAISRSRIDLNQLLRAMQTSMEPEFQNKGVDCRCELSETPQFVQGNPDYFELAIEHLLNNAINHTHSGGKIAIRSRCAGERAIVEITDTGCGIGQADLPHIFERFYRADKAGTTSGLGLGLAIVQAVVERSGGHVEVESVVGENSTFRLILPSV